MTIIFFSPYDFFVFGYFGPDIQDSILLQLNGRYNPQDSTQGHFYIYISLIGLNLISTKIMAINYITIFYSYNFRLVSVLLELPARALPNLSIYCSIICHVFCPCVRCLWFIIHSVSFTGLGLLIFPTFLYAFRKTATSRM